MPGFRRVLSKSLSGSRKGRHRSPSPDGLDAEDIPAASISKIFADIALYKQCIFHPERESFEEVSGNQTLQDFAELMGNDLDPPEKTVARHFAQYTSDSGKDLQPLTEEPEPLSEEGSVSSHSLDSTSPPASSASTSFEGTEYTSVDSSDSKLSSEDVVALLEDEFGQLSTDGSERLLHELDAALIQDVVILGVVHVTTHRLTFHASLPASRPDLFPNDKPLKVGLTVIHRKGFYRKRRVWLELSRDFLCAFPSAQEDDHIKPWKSILLSSIKKVLPEDPHETRSLVSVCMTRATTSFSSSIRKNQRGTGGEK